MKYLFNVIILSAALCATTHRAKAQDKSGNEEIARYVNRAPFKMPAITEPVFAKAVFNIIDYGAKGDGQTLNTEAIAKAIAACTAAGGGMVLVPAGLWLTGDIELKSNVNLHTDKGALVIFSTDHTIYPVNNGRVQSFLYGSNLKNVGITGEGIYDGGGDTWRPLKKSKAAPTLWNDLVKSGGVLNKDGSMWYPTKEALDNDHLRPVMVSVQNSQNVLIDGPTFKNSPNFGFAPKSCTNMIIRNLHINNEYYAQNGDAMDISVSKNVIVYHCTINAGDDGICMKSSGGDGGANAGLENVIIADNTVYHAHGGFVVGSNTDGGMNNIWVTNCNFVNTDIGIRIKSNKGRGGLVHNFYIDHIFMRDILNEAILFSSYYDAIGSGGATGPEPQGKVPHFEDFHISNVYCNNAKIAVSIIGLPDAPVNKIDFTDIVISANKAFYATEAADINVKNFKIISPDKTVFNLNNAGNIHITNAGFDAAAKTFVSAEGAKTVGITVTSTDIKKLPDAVKLGSGVDKSAVTVN